ncbi:unnamed protein product [Dicrocoelium dendriticum]|nr:unnamed protein product [Dicrocoelium dendriticum]
MEPAAYVLFDELHEQFDEFRSILSGKNSIPIRLLCRMCAYNSSDCSVEVISPTKGNEFPCLVVSASYLPDEEKQNLAGAASKERLVQFTGDLTALEHTRGYKLNAFASAFMDGVDLSVYRSIVELTRPYIKYLPPL